MSDKLPEVVRVAGVLVLAMAALFVPPILLCTAANALLSSEAMGTAIPVVGFGWFFVWTVGGNLLAGAIGEKEMNDE